MWNARSTQGIHQQHQGLCMWNFVDMYANTEEETSAYACKAWRQLAITFACLYLTWRLKHVPLLCLAHFGTLVRSYFLLANPCQTNSLCAALRCSVSALGKARRLPSDLTWCAQYPWPMAPELYLKTASQRCEPEKDHRLCNGTRQAQPYLLDL